LIGDLWYNELDGELYISYDNGGSQIWVTAVPNRPVLLIDGGDETPATPPFDNTSPNFNLDSSPEGAGDGNFAF
jgi:hypothetical protein